MKVSLDNSVFTPIIVRIENEQELEVLMNALIYANYDSIYDNCSVSLQDITVILNQFHTALEKVAPKE